MFCVPLEKQNVGWTLLGVRIGSGKVGTVEAACKIENCSYVAKIIPFGQNYNKRSFNKEVKSLVDWALNNNIVPVFEYVSPNNRIVLRYPSEELILLRLRDNVTGKHNRHVSQ